MNEAKRKKRRKRKIRLYIRRFIFFMILIGIIGAAGFAVNHFIINGLINNGRNVDSNMTAEKKISRDELIHSGKIYDGIYLDEIEVSGLDYSDAMKAYEEYHSSMGNQKVTFIDSLGKYSTKLSDIGLNVEVEDAVCDALTFGRTGNILTRYKEIQMLKNDHITLIPEKTIKEDVLERKLSEEAEDMVKEPVSSTMLRSEGKFVVYPSETGLAIDEKKTIQLVKDELAKEWKRGDIVINAATEVVEPEYSEEDFYGVDTLLGRAVTEYNTKNSERISNLVVGAKKIADNVVLPGEQFSVYDTVAPFTEENGYRNAGQYINAELVDGLGGGICQVATTLYDAVLEAELSVDERYPHSMTVKYVQPAFDAAIADNDYIYVIDTNDTIEGIVSEYTHDPVQAKTIYRVTRDGGKTGLERME